MSGIWLITIVLFLFSYSKYNINFRISQLGSNSTSSILNQYFKSFSYDVLFGTIDDYRLTNPWGRGQSQLIILPFFIIGLYGLTKINKNYALILLLYLILTPIPSSIAGSGNHPVRNIPLIFPFVIITAIGVDLFLKNIMERNMSKIFMFIISAIFLIETIFFLKYYFNEYSNEYAYLWGKPQLEMYEFSKKISFKFDNVVFTDTFNSTLSYFAFYSKIEPVVLRKAILNPVSINSLPSKKIGKYYFLTTEEISTRDLYNFFDIRTIIIDPLLFVDDSSIDQNDIKLQKYFKALIII